MKFRLIFQNMRRSTKDYMIYISTMVMCIGILYAFLSIAFSNNISRLAENMMSMQEILIGLSIVVVFFFSFLINYAMKFIIKRRKKEFGTYILLGFERKHIFRIFFTENVILGVVSLFIGIPFGFLLYQIFYAMITNLFDVPYHVDTLLTIKPILMCILLFFIIYGVSAIKSSYMIANMKIKELIYSARHNEMVSIKNPIVRLFLNVVFMMIIIVSLCLMIYCLKLEDNNFFIVIVVSFIGLMVGVYGVHYGIPTFLFLLKKYETKWLYHSNNMFLAGQIFSKVNSNAKTIAASASALTIALILLLAGLSLGVTYKSNIEYEAPFDVTVAIDADVISLKDVLDYIETKVDVKDYIEYKIYYADEIELKGVPILKLSDYNYLRNLIGLQTVSISENQFIIHSDTWSIRRQIEKNLEEKNEITLEGNILTSNMQCVYSEPFEQMRTNGDSGYILVVPDALCDKLDANKSRLVVSTLEPAYQELKKDLIGYIKNQWLPEFNKISDEQIENKITMFVNVKSWSIANGLTGLAIFSFCSIYISLILFLIVGTILALQQSSESTENKYRFMLLKNLGVNESDLLHLMKRQVAIYFALPAIFPITLTIIVGFCLNNIFKNYILIENVILLYTAITIAIFVVVYNCYMVMSYKTFKWSVLYKIEHKDMLNG